MHSSGARHSRAVAARARDHAGSRLGLEPARTVGVFALPAALLVGFVAWENRVAEPLMRFGILRTKTVLGANVAGFILGTALFSMFPMLDALHAAGARLPRR